MLDVMGAAAAAVAVAATTALVVHLEASTPGIRTLGPLGYLLAAAGGAALAFRNVAPYTTFAATLGIGIAYQGLGYPGGPAPFPIVIALFTIAAIGARVLSLGLGLLASVALVSVRGLAVADGFGSPLLIVFPTCAIGGLYLGQLLANRRQREREREQEAEARRRIQEDDTRRRVDAERLRIARELHDVVAHNISLIHVQATMGVHVMHDDPVQAGAALAEIKLASKQALGELRGILGVLRQSDDVKATAPAPGLADLDTVITGIRRAGLPVALTIQGRRRPLPALLDIAAYRIVQESLTNALRYAAPAPTQVTIAYTQTCLRLEIHDEGRGNTFTTAAGSGHGIDGMRERAASAGGTLTAGPTGSGGFAVRAELPLPQGMT
jgi:signal transduction histidine kinase